MNCQICNNQTTFVAQYQQWFCGACNKYQHGAPPLEQGGKERLAQAKTLVMWSHILGWGGVAMLFVGPVIVSAAGGGSSLALGASGLGLVSAIVGAIIGQVGRAQQGRVI